MRAIYLDKAFPDVYRAMVDLSKQADAAALGTGLPMTLLELVKLRASQLNGCAYCLRKHTRIALDQGESTDRIAVLQNWRDTGYFTEQEQAALELVEEITLIADVTAGRRPAAPRPDVLTEEQIAAVRWVGLTINAFNRLSIASEHPVDPPAAPAAPSPPAAAAPAAAPPAAAPPAAPAPQPAAPAPGVVEELSEFMHSDDRDE
jgi:AhpD family alkylhydroperoxidase